MDNKSFLQNITKLIEGHIEQDKKTGHEYELPHQVQCDITMNKEGMDEQEFRVLLDTIGKKTPPTANKTFFNQLFGGRLLPALAGEIMSNVFNNSMYTYKASGVHTLIEKEVVREMLLKVGFTDGDGIFNSGGSISNMVAIMHAAQYKVPGFKKRGRQGRRCIIYTSAESHYSIKKGAGLLGVGYENVREISIDPSTRKMNVAHLQELIKEDIAQGFFPMMINATAGTTVWGAFDPLLDIATVAQENNIWFHVDASRGGGVLMNDKYKHLVQGIQYAHSVSWNPHKMLNVPLSLSAFLVRDKVTLYKTMSTEADYLFQTESDYYNHGTKYLQCGRQNNTFKFWCAWKYLGHDGYAKRVQQQFDLVSYAVEIITKEHRLTLLMYPPFLNVCFAIKGVDAGLLCERLDQKGLIKVGYGKTDHHGKFIRMICVDPDMNQSDIDYFFQELLDEANKL